MANLEVTTVCNLDCPFCFAQKYIGDATKHTGNKFISIANYQAHLDFLDRSNIDEVRFIGGEPTLHPEFPLLVQLALERKKKIVVFSNGLMPQKAVQSLQIIDPNNCIVLINATASRRNGHLSQRAKQQRVSAIRMLGERVILGYTIFSSNFDISDLIVMIHELGCRKMMRVGLAHPISSEYSSSIHPQQYKHIGQKLFELAGKAYQSGIRLEFDCGFVRCMFTEEQIEALKSYDALFGWHCSPVLDIHISGTIIMCFPNDGLANIQLSNVADAKQARDEMIVRTSIYRNVGIFPECSSCNFKREHVCSGGGLEHITYRFKHTPFQIHVSP